MIATPENIETLKDNEIFVFGSNESGIHGAGAALFAMKKFGARYGQGWGHYGQSFAIPTKDWNINTLKLYEIGNYVDRFYYYVRDRKNLHFLITEIGCGLAGYKPQEIAPLFSGFFMLDNVSLPQKFIQILSTEETEY